MKIRETFSVITTSSFMLAGCGQGEYTAERELAPTEVTRQIGEAALDGVWVVPYEIVFDDGATVERSFASVDGKVECLKVGEQRRTAIDMLYATARDMLYTVTEDEKHLVQFEPPVSDKHIHAELSDITAQTVQCVQFDLADGDKFINGLPVTGVFESGERSFVVKPGK